MNAACNVVYVDRSAHKERMVRRGEVLMDGADGHGDPEANESARKLQVNVQTLLGTFNKGACGERCGGLPRPAR